jgi:hypothetical protein
MQGLPVEVDAGEEAVVLYLFPGVTAQSFLGVQLEEAVNEIL